VLLRPIDAEPGANRLQGHAQEYYENGGQPDGR
jgi:hypothetical protein